MIAIVERWRDRTSDLECVVIQTNNEPFGLKKWGVILPITAEVSSSLLTVPETHHPTEFLLKQQKIVLFPSMYSHNAKNYIANRLANYLSSGRLPEWYRGTCHWIKL